MGFVFAALLGGIIGWLASLLLPGEGQKRLWPGIATGIVGGLLGGFVLGPVLGGGNLLESKLDPMTLFDAALGAALLLTTVHFVRRRRRRP